MFVKLFRKLGIIALSLQLCCACAAWAAEAAHAEHDPAAEHAEHHEAGLPMHWKQDLALFSLVTFAVYLAVLRFGAWVPLREGLSERERRIRQDIADAEANRIKSEALIAEREAKLAVVQDEIRELIAEARRDADRTKQDIVTTAQREADATRQRAVADIERARDQALSELFDFVASNVVNATERVIARSLNAGDHERLVNEALSEMNVRRN